MTTPYSVPNLSQYIKTDSDAKVNTLTFGDDTEQTTAAGDPTKIEDGAVSVTTESSAPARVDFAISGNVATIKASPSRMEIPEIRSPNSSGIKISNDAGTNGIFVSDDGHVTMGNADTGSNGFGNSYALCPLSVYGKSDTYMDGDGNPRGFLRDTNPGTAYNLRNMGIYVEESLMSNGYVAASYGTLTASDRRIKKNITDTDDNECLLKLRQLEPKKYRYKDNVQRGDQYVYGFIAQDVSNVIQGSTMTTDKTIPNIYSIGIISDGNKITFDASFNVSDILTDVSNNINMYDLSNQGHDLSFISIDTSTNSIIVDRDITSWGGNVDASDNVVPGDEIFVYGQHVKNFVTLKKDAIWTITTSAVQEIDRQQQIDKQKITDLEQRISALETIILNN